MNENLIKNKVRGIGKNVKGIATMSGKYFKGKATMSSTTKYQQEK